MPSPVTAAHVNRIGDGDVILGIDGRLHIVADNAAVVAAGRHGAGVRIIAERNLPVREDFQLPANRLEFAKAAAATPVARSGARAAG